MLVFTMHVCGARGNIVLVVNGSVHCRLQGCHLCALTGQAKAPAPTERLRPCFRVALDLSWSVLRRPHDGMRNRLGPGPRSRARNFPPGAVDAMSARFASAGGNNQRPSLLNPCDVHISPLHTKPEPPFCVATTLARVCPGRTVVIWLQRSSWQGNLGLPGTGELAAQTFDTERTRHLWSLNQACERLKT